VVSSLLTKTIAASGAGLLLAGLAAAPALAAAQPAPPTSASARFTGGSASADPGKTTRGGTVAVGGGVWTFGVNKGRITSVFDTTKFTHKTSTCDGWNRCDKPGYVPAGTLAVSHHASTAFGNSAYWNIR
jgi:hypothetical protein